MSLIIQLTMFDNIFDVQNVASIFYVHVHTIITSHLPSFLFLRRESRDRYHDDYDRDRDRDRERGDRDRYGKC